MNQESFEVMDGVGHFRLSGACRFPQAVQAISAAIAKADQRGPTGLLIVTTEATGFDPPGMADRHAMVREWGQASMGHVAIALVVPPAPSSIPSGSGWWRREISACTPMSSATNRKRRPGFSMRGSPFFLPSIRDPS